MLDSLIEQVHQGRRRPDGLPTRGRVHRRRRPRRNRRPEGAERGRRGRPPRRRGRRRPEHVRGRPLRLGQRLRDRGPVPAAHRQSGSARGRRIIDEHLRRGALPHRRRRPRRGCRARAAGRSGGSVGPRRRARAPARSGADPRVEAPCPRLGLRARQIRPGAPHADAFAGLRHGRRGAAAVERLRPRPGALEPLHRRARDLRVAAAQRQAADDLRGRPSAPRLRPCRGRRPRFRARARAPEGGGRGLQHRQRRRPLGARGGGVARERHGPRPTSGPRSPARRAPATSATASPTSPKPARSSASRPKRDFAQGLAELAEWVARQEAEDRVHEARKELELRGLVA